MEAISMWPRSSLCLQLDGCTQPTGEGQMNHRPTFPPPCPFSSQIMHGSSHTDILDFFFSDYRQTTTTLSVLSLPSLRPGQPALELLH